MKGYRAPHFGNLHTEDVYPVLYKLGYYSSSMALQYSKSKVSHICIIKISLNFQSAEVLIIHLLCLIIGTLLKKKPLFKNDETIHQ